MRTIPHSKGARTYAALLYDRDGGSASTPVADSKSSGIDIFVTRLICVDYVYETISRGQALTKLVRSRRSARRKSSRRLPNGWKENHWNESTLAFISHDMPATFHASA